MSTSSYVALLRGINVGGKNKVPMADLRAVFQDAGFASVRTYIQSGNVVFSTDQPAKILEDQIEEAVERGVGLGVKVVVRSGRQLRAIVERAPEGFGQQPDTFHSDVVFLRAPLTAAKAMDVVKLRDGVDLAWPGTNVVYFARLSERRTQSRLSRVVGTPEYQHMTIRNWRTTTTLHTMVNESLDGTTA